MQVWHHPRSSMHSWWAGLLPKELLLPPLGKCKKPDTFFLFLSLSLVCTTIYNIRSFLSENNISCNSKLFNSFLQMDPAYFSLT